MKYLLLLLFALACVSETNDLEGFCGTSTNSYCNKDIDCGTGGCSGQICGDSDAITTCEYKECYNNKKYNATCSCVENKCMWN